MSCYPKYQIRTYYQDGPNKGNTEFILTALSLEEARNRRETYIKIDKIKNPALYPTIFVYEIRNKRADYYYLEG